MQKTIGLSLIASICLLTGCQNRVIVDSTPAFSNVGLTQNRRDLVLKDVAIPEDFAMCPGSYCHGTDSFRYAEMEYQGQLSIDDVYSFYQKVMPNHGWNELEAKQLEGTARMVFEKKGELCTILLREGKEITEMKIIVEQKKS